MVQDRINVGMIVYNDVHTEANGHGNNMREYKSTILEHN